MPSTISFGFACVPDDAGIVGCAVAYFMFYPCWLIVFNWLVSMIDDRKYFFFASWLVLSFAYVYADAFSQALEVERPAPFDWELCRTTRYATPDAQFVSSIAYTLVVAVGLWRDKHRFGVLQAAVAYSTPLIYIIATVYTGYLSIGQMLLNLGISVASAAFFVWVYGDTNGFPWKVDE